MSRVVPLGRVLRAEEAGLYRDAAGALQMAAERERTVSEAAAADRAALAARVRIEALEAAQGEAAQYLASASAGVVRELAGLRQQMAEAIADGVAAILGARPLAEIAAAAAAHAITTLQDRVGITLRVPPQHLDAVERALSTDGLNVLADATLEPDELVIETAAGFVRGGIRAQLDRLREALQQAAAA